MAVLSVLRVVAGALFILFLPGFTWTWVLCDKQRTSILERVVYSFALSVALISIAFFFCSRLGVRIDFLSSLVIVVIITLLPFMHILLRKKGIYARLTPRRWRDEEQSP